jgi:hypothetical protein
MSTRKSSDSEPQLTSPLLSQPSSPPKEPQPPRIGDPSEPLTLSRIKLNAVHAGLSLLLPPWNQLNSSKRVETSSPSPNKSSSLAIRLATDATVDGNPTVCNTLPKTVKLLRLNTHTPQDTENPDLASARDLQQSTLLRLTPSNPTLPPNFWPPLPKDQSLLPSKPIKLLSKVTPVVF